MFSKNLGIIPQLRLYNDLYPSYNHVLQYQFDYRGLQVLGLSEILRYLLALAYRLSTRVSIKHNP